MLTLNPKMYIFTHLLTRCDDACVITPYLFIYYKLYTMHKDVDTQS